MSRFKQPCIVCKKLSAGGIRCEVHQKIYDAVADEKKRNRKIATGQYSGSYQRRAKAVREQATNCHICGQGYRPDDPWQADHLIPADPDSPLLPAHRSCNARRGNRPLT